MIKVIGCRGIGLKIETYCGDSCKHKFNDYACKYINLRYKDNLSEYIIR